MANTLLLFHDKSLWMGDWYLRIIIYYLAPFIKKLSENESLTSENREWFNTYYEDNLIFFGLGWIIAGGINLNLEGVAENKERLSLFIRSMNNVKDILHAKGTELSVSELQKVDDLILGEEFIVTETVPTKLIISEINQILDMLNDPKT